MGNKIKFSCITMLFEVAFSTNTRISVPRINDVIHSTTCLGSNQTVIMAAFI
uniref:Uncharacterized protein n=1 Tax=Arundo donax TaxID=35708 RepID=A0A0A9ESD9_ARUDO